MGEVLCGEGVLGFERDVVAVVVAIAGWSRLMLCGWRWKLCVCLLGLWRKRLILNRRRQSNSCALRFLHAVHIIPLVAREPHAISSLRRESRARGTQCVELFVLAQKSMGLGSVLYALRGGPYGFPADGRVLVEVDGVVLAAF